MSSVYDPRAGAEGLAPRGSRRQSGGRFDRPSAPRRGGRTDPRGHGWTRASDHAGSTSAATTGRHARAGASRRLLPGASLLLTLVIAGLAFAAASRVYGRTRILELGAEITELTTEQGRLLDERRRLQAERAYLRHPSHIQRLAGGGGGLAPADPARIQAIELRSAAGDATHTGSSDAEDRER